MRGRIPVALIERQEVAVRWLDAKGAHFHEPFFGDTVQRLRDDADRESGTILETGIQELIDFGRAHPSLCPTGFIFHVSRCGSTLIAQILSAMTRNLVISEPRPLGHLLSARSRYPKTLWIRAMQGLVGALGQRWCGTEKNYFIKFDSIDILDLPLIREAFPGVRAVFLYRDPLEVLVSNAKLPAQSWIWNTLPLREAVHMRTVDVIAQVLAAKYDAMRLYADAMTLLLNYTELSLSTPQRLADFFGVGASDEEIALMQQRLQIDAKDHKRRPFAPDGEDKAKWATDSMRASVARWLTSPYERLETLRLSRQEPSS